MNLNNKICSSVTFLLLLIFVVSVNAQRPDKFEFQGVCGDPRMESDSWRPVFGKVVEITSRRTFIIEHDGKKRTVDLAALDATEDEMLAKEFMLRKTLNRQVKVWVSPSRSNETHVTGQVWLRNKDLN